MRDRIVSIFLLSVLAIGQQPFKAATPTTMTKIAVRLQSPDVPEGSFAAQPKVIYRAGTGYCRIEEAPDKENGIHGIVIINEPDSWLVNLLSTEPAQHMVDPGPTFDCALPIFAAGESIGSSEDLHKPLMELEFGREMSYFREKGAVPVKGPTLGGKSTNAYTVEIAGSQLFLFTGGTPERPVAVARQHGSKRDTFWYGSYEELPFDPKLFAKPEGKIKDVK